MDNKNGYRPVKNYSPESEALRDYKSKKRMINRIMSILVLTFLVLTVYAMVNYDTFYESPLVKWVVPYLLGYSMSIRKASMLLALGTAIVSGILTLVNIILWFVLIFKLNIKMIDAEDSGMSHYVSQSASNARIDKALSMSNDAMSVYSTNKKVNDK